MTPIVSSFGGMSKRGYFPGGPSLPVVTGGTLTSDATYYYRTFTSNGSLVVTGTPLTDAAYFINNGGAGGANGYDSGPSAGGGGGGGNYYVAVNQTFNTGSYAVVIGGGGAGDTGPNAYNNAFGSASSFNSVSPLVKGNLAFRQNGGSVYAAGLITTTDSPPEPPVRAGGTNSQSYTAGSGGAGNFGNGVDGYLTGNGGNGYLAFDGVKYGGGGGGGGLIAYPGYSSARTTPGSGTDGGGTGGNPTGSRTNPVAGLANRGGGGGGAYDWWYVDGVNRFISAAANGGSGIVIVRYLRSVVGG